MADILGENLRNLKRLKIHKNRMTAIVLILSLLVSVEVFWVLRQPGLTLAGDASCKILEHIHDDDCMMQVCVCGMEEGTHTHDDSCYETILVETEEVEEVVTLVCEQTEEPHTHSDGCYETILVDTEETVFVCDCEDVKEL